MFNETDFENDTIEFKSKEQINIKGVNQTKGHRMEDPACALLEHSDLTKVRSYLTHAGLNPGVVSTLEE